MSRTNLEENPPTLQRVLDEIAAINGRLDHLALPSIKARISSIEHLLCLEPIQQASRIPPDANCFQSGTNNNSLAFQVNNINCVVNRNSLLTEETKRAVEGLTA